MTVPQPARLVELPQRRRPAQAVLVALRPRQWTKNALLFAGIVFAAKLGDWARWLEALAAFAAYCAASSAAYLVNDIRDADHDRAHPVKRARPIARGELSPHTAYAIAAVLAVVSIALILPLGWPSLAFLCAFFALQAGYTARLKHVVLIDAVRVCSLGQITDALLLCTALLALFLAFAKRRGELVLVGAEATPGRPVLEGYSLELVDQLVSVVAACTVIAYSLYTFTARDSKALMATIPFVVFGVFRYLLLIHRRDLGEEPEEVLLRDRPILACIAAWAVCAAVILALT